MRQPQNNDIRTFPRERGKGIAGTVILHLIAFTVFFIFRFSMPPPPETEEGILVNFGFDETGSGLIEPSLPPVQEEVPPPLPAEAETPSKEEPLLTQNTEEAPVVKKVDPEAEKKRPEEIRAEQKRREEMEAARLLQARLEAARKQRIADSLRQEKIAADVKAKLAASKNAGTTSTSEGAAGGQGNQGAPTGSVGSQNRGDGTGLGDVGVSYDLGGRKPKKNIEPPYTVQREGIVVVQIRVDRSGKVILATEGRPGTTILDPVLLKVAKEAALQNQFDTDPSAPEIQIGKIIYNFKLK